MEVKKMVKRLFAVGAGITMLGATVMSATAADLSKYPDMFVDSQKGVFNGLFVVGENAAPIDNLAMTDIAVSMKYPKPAATATVTVEGDAWKVGTSTKSLEMSNTNSTPEGEQIYDIEQWIGKDELKALADGTYSTNEGKYAFTQYLYFDVKNSNQNEIVAYRENDDDVTDVFFFVKSSGNIGEYRIEFSSSPESTVQDTAGSTSTTGTVLDDFEDTKINFLGKQYDIVLARRPQSTPEDSIKLTLMGGAVSGSLREGESETYELNGNSYEVSLIYTDSTYAKFTVNGESTSKLQVGETYKLSDGKEVGVSEILYQSYAGGVHSAKFFLGATKMELRDNDITNTAGGTEMSIGAETIDGADVIITGSDDNTTFRLISIRVNMTAQDDYFVGKDGKLSAAITAAGDENEVLFTNNWDIEYKGLADVETHEIKVYSTTDRKYQLQFYDGDNKQVQMPLFYAVDNTNITMTEDATDKEVIINEAMNISKNDYFVVTQGTASDGTAKTYVLQYKGADKSTATSPKIQFKNLGSSETLEYAVGTATDNSATATIKLGGYSWSVYNKSSKESSDFTIGVDLSGSTFADIGTAANEVDIIDAYGLQIDFGGVFGYSSSNGGQVLQPLSTNVTSLQMNFTTPNGDDFGDQNPPTIQFQADATTTNEVTGSDFNIDAGTGDVSLTPEGEENIGYGYTTMGAKWTYKSPSGSPNEFILEYPKTQRLPQVYVTSGAVTSSTSSTGDLTQVTIVDATKLDSEIADVKAQNLIVVGGPCVNTVAAELLGSPTDCTEGFTPGKARIKLWEHANGNVAMLVAGYSGADTRLAGKVIAHRYKELSGTEVEVEGTTYSDATIGAPTVKEEAAETPAAE
ncbi:MAG: hypothetical protein AB1668_01005 [Nanoarchaeota archaeon]